MNRKLRGGQSAACCYYVNFQRRKCGQDWLTEPMFWCELSNFHFERVHEFFELCTLQLSARKWDEKT